MGEEDAPRASAGERDEADDGPVDGDGDEAEHGDRDHLADVEVGAGCTEIWEHLADHHRED